MDVSNAGLIVLFTALAALGSIAAAIATWVAVVVAQKALNTWKEEHIKKAQWELATRAIKAAHALKYVCPRVKHEMYFSLAHIRQDFEDKCNTFAALELEARIIFNKDAGEYWAKLLDPAYYCLNFYGGDPDERPEIPEILQQADLAVKEIEEFLAPYIRLD